ncbi:phosphodiesterase [Prodigiosinella confusarubida]|uniref:Phosphodiesterase n=1 Tax=Serratia sp. (strain ATCC 39006) TaxID=104623 RepID=A0A2I5TPG9_SERS3|nr:phosphodiesterase [Serratia sp. ATCC 39006]AUH02141.1 phosphodiesterase [Serratia sp. ATCC 39006]AUH06462.1 phosphodiesterase [Serratia sp. ATCC 39006]
MLLAHISDTHFRSQGQKLYGFIDINAGNADVVSQLNALTERPDAVVISGDIVNCGHPAEYQVARQILGYLRYPLYIIPGNHDDKTYFLEYLHPLCPQLGNDPENMRYAIDDYPMRLLFIDSSRTGTSKGWLTEETLAWLETQLSTSGDKPTAVFMHHPPIALGSAQMDPIACENGYRLLELVERFPSLVRIFCGHNHCLIMTQYRQAIIATLPGTVHQVPYFHEDKRPYYNMSPPACLMHRLVDNHLVSYLHSLAHYAGPWLYDETISYPVDEQ